MVLRIYGIIIVLLSSTKKGGEVMQSILLSFIKNGIEKPKESHSLGFSLSCNITIF